MTWPTKPSTPRRSCRWSHLGRSRRRRGRNAKVQAGAVSEAKLSAAVQDKLNTAGVSDLEELQALGNTVGADAAATLTPLQCPEDKVAISGGILQTSPALAGIGDNIQMVSSSRVPGNPRRWRFIVENPAAADRSFATSVLCATPGT